MQQLLVRVLLSAALASAFGLCAISPTQRLKHIAPRDSLDLSSLLFDNLLERDTCGPGPACGEPEAPSIALYLSLTCVHAKAIRLQRSAVPDGSVVGN